MTEKKLVLTSDPKVLEFLRYLGVDPDLTRHVVITVPLNGPVVVDENRFSEKKAEES